MSFFASCGLSSEIESFIYVALCISLLNTFLLGMNCKIAGAFMPMSSTETTSKLSVFFSNYDRYFPQSEEVVNHVECFSSRFYAGISGSSIGYYLLIVLPYELYLVEKLPLLWCSSIANSSARRFYFNMTFKALCCAPVKFFFMITIRHMRNSVRFSDFTYVSHFSIMESRVESGIMVTLSMYFSWVCHF